MYHWEQIQTNFNNAYKNAYKMFNFYAELEGNAYLLKRAFTESYRTALSRGSH